MAQLPLPRVVMLDFLNETKVEQEILAGVAHVEPWSLNSNADLPRVAEAVGEVDALLGWHMLHYDRATLELFKKCKVLVRVGIGIDAIDLKSAGELGIYVANVPDYGVEEVADSAMSHILNIMRNTAVTYMQYTENKWRTDKLKGATRLRGQVIGIVGLGKIGKAVALRSKAFGLDVVFYDPYLDDGIDKALGVRRVDTLEDLIRQSDILSLHCWLDEKNKHLINAKALSYIKPGGIYFVNVARGGLVDEVALIEALKDGRIKAAGLDVTEKEPYPADGPLLKLPNVLITPHSAFYSDQSFEEMREKAAREVKRVLEGGVPRNFVNSQFIQNPIAKR